MGIRTRTSGIMVPSFVAPAAGDGSAEAASWAAAVVTNGGSVSGARQSLVATMIGSLKSGGIWTKLDRLWITAAENEPSALTDMTAAHDLAINQGTATFTTDRGYEGQDSASPTKYIDTTWNPSTQGVLFTQDDGHFSVWVRSSPGDGNGGCNAGITEVGVSQCNLYDVFTDGNLYGRLNDASPPDGSFGAPSDRTGHWVVNRTGASAGAVYRSGNTTPFGTKTAASGARPNGAFFVLCVSTGGTPQSGTANQVSAFSAGGALTTGQVTSFYNALQTYMTAVGA